MHIANDPDLGWLLLYAVSRLIKDQGYEDNTMRITEEEVLAASRRTGVTVWREELNNWWVIKVVELAE